MDEKRVSNDSKLILAIFVLTICSACSLIESAPLNFQFELKSPTPESDLALPTEDQIFYSPTSTPFAEDLANLVATEVAKQLATLQTEQPSEPHGSLLQITTATPWPNETQSQMASSTYVSLPPEPGMYSSEGLLNLEEGSISVWVRLQPNVYRRDHVILHSDDSRIILYLDTYSVSSRDVELTRFAAKVGGSRKAYRAGVPNMHVPEASIVFDKPGLEGYGDARAYVGRAPIREGEWYFLTMTWDGWPMGLVSIYLDGIIMAQQVYDPRYEDGRPAMTSFAVGVRPAEWTGEIITLEDGSKAQLVPSTDMSMLDGGIEIFDLRVYARGLNDYEIQDLYAETSGQLP